MMGGFDGMMGEMGGWGGYGLAGGLLNVLLLVGLLAFVAWVAVRVVPNKRLGDRSFGTRTDAAEEVLRQRFARGELDAEEYERSLKTLRGEPHRNYEDYVRDAREPRR